MPRLTVLQLDTAFPRIAGDVAAAATYTEAVDIIRMPQASVAKVVATQPDGIDITAFEDAVASISSGVITTSCGFLGYWQEHLSRLTTQPVITSSLCRLDHLCQQYGRGKVAIVTFDAAVLRAPLYAPLLGDFGGPVIGLEDHHHLRRVIADDLTHLDRGKAEAELISHLSGQLDGIEAVLLECTNLPPYKAALKKACGVAVFDILNAIDALTPGLVKPAFL